MASKPLYMLGFVTDDGGMADATVSHDVEALKRLVEAEVHPKSDTQRAKLAAKWKCYEDGYELRVPKWDGSFVIAEAHVIEESGDA